MQENLEKIQRFFKKNVEIKTIIAKALPNRNYQADQQSLVAYSEYLYQSLFSLKCDIMMMLKDYNFGEKNEEYVNKLFDQYKERLESCGLNFGKLSSFYEECLASMNENLIEKVGNECKGYTVFNHGRELIQQSKTVNELLHVIHQSIVNDEQVYQSMPKLAEKKNDKGYNITLYGIDSKLGKEIYEAIPNSLDIGLTDILSLPKSQQILMMVRDRGHALMMEIDTSQKKDLITYFIPKICNVQMVQQLKGVRKGLITKGYTTGSFEIEKENTAKELISFIEKVPTDEDSVLYDSYKTRDDQRNISELEDMLMVEIQNHNGEGLNKRCKN